MISYEINLSLDKNHACVINSDCINNEGSYDCSCKIGYDGDPTKRCLDIDECRGMVLIRLSFELVMFKVAP